MKRRHSLASLALGTITAAPSLAQPSAPAVLPVADVDPATLFGPDVYPAAAIRAGEQGRVVTRLDIDATGKVTRCRVDVSSGSAALDQTTCAIALGRAHYRPARDEHGRGLAATVTLPVRWVLPEGLPSYITLAPTSFVIHQAVDATGQPGPCAFKVDGVPSQDPQPCSREKALAEIASALPLLTREERSAPFVLISEARQEYSGRPNPPVVATTGLRVIDRDATTFRVEADGSATGCRKVKDGKETADPTSMPCSNVPPFGPAGTYAPGITGRWTSMTAIRPGTSLD